MHSRKFRLQRLLDIRAKQVEEYKRKLAEAARQMATAENIQASVEKRGESLARDWQFAATQGLHSWQMADFEFARQIQQRELLLARAEVERTRAAIATARAELEMSMIRLKTLEKARERAFLRADAEAMRQEQIRLDEFATMMGARS